MQKFPVSFYLDTRRAVTTGQHAGKFPVKLRIEFGGDVRQKYYHTGEYLSVKEFERALSEKPGRALRDVSDHLVKVKARAVEIIRDTPVINPELFELFFTGKAVTSANVQVLFKIHIDRFNQAGKIKSRDSYQCALNSILSYAHGDVPESSGLLLNNIDKDFLEGYERWAKERGISVTTIGIYLRNLRAVFNDAIDNRRILSRDLYPFGKRGYRIPTAKNRKKALSDKAKKLLFSYKPANERESEAMDFFKMFYYCDGINPIDIAYLHEDQLDGDSFRYVRKKTETTEREQVTMQVHLRKEVKDIIRRRGTHSPYIFGIITPDMSPERKRRNVENFVSRVNDNLERITKKLGIPKITTYTARHTVATTYLRKGVDLKTIQERLGHSSLEVTEAYLESIEMEEQKKLNRLL